MSGILAATNKHNLEWDYVELVNELGVGLIESSSHFVPLSISKWCSATRFQCLYTYREQGGLGGNNKRQTKCNPSLAVVTLNLTKLGKIDMRANILCSAFTVTTTLKKTKAFPWSDYDLTTRARANTSFQQWSELTMSEWNRRTLDCDDCEF